jgi:hypothetical protein
VRLDLHSIRARRMQARKLYATGMATSPDAIPVWTCASQFEVAQVPFVRSFVCACLSAVADSLCKPIDSLHTLPRTHEPLAPRRAAAL